MRSRRIAGPGILVMMVLTVAGRAGGQLTIGNSFQGSTFNSSGFFPPDTMGAIGPDHFVELLNGRYAAYLKDSGALIQASSLDTFWLNAGVNPAGSFAFDPRVLYDTDSGRWFAVSVDAPGSPNNFLVAVSATSDPTDGWTGFQIDSDSDNLQWADFPLIGIDDEGVYVVGKMFQVSNAPFVINILILPKDDLLLPVPSIANRTLLESISSNTTGFTPQIAVDFDFDPGFSVPILARFSSSSLRRTTLTGSVLNPVLSSGPLIGTSTFFNPPTADQPPLPVQKPDIDSGDARLGSNVILRNGILWAVQTGGSGGRAAVRFLKVDAATNVLLQSVIIGDIDLAYYYPSIAVNEFEEVVIGFSGSSSTQPVSTYAVGGATIGGVTTFGDPILLRAGTDDYARLDGIGRNRWGDYSATTVDPVDSNRFWTIQEFVIADDIWATEITELIFTPDCNGNGIPDSEDIANGTSNDCNSNAVPDECETDCNQNRIPDDCDIADRTSDDCNANAIPDECETDCNENLIPDDCDIANRTSDDCNSNLVPDECDIAVGTSLDLDGNGIPDECKPSPSNDECVTPLVVSEGSFPFTTIGASTDGLPQFCEGGGGGVEFDDDTWFLYTPTCTAEVTFSVCNAATFDTRLAVYFEAVCPPSAPLACSDDAAGCGVTSEVTVFVFPLASYLVRVGATAGGGTGTLTISCPIGDSCPWDLDDDGMVGITDFLALLAAWGPNPGHPADFDDDGIVGITDFLDLLGNWGLCP